MKSKSGKGGKEGIGGLTLGDFRLWRDFTHDVDTYEEHDREALEKLIVAQSPDTQIIKGTPRTEPVIPTQHVPKKIESQEPQLDARTEHRIRSGKMPIEGKLDLHGFNQIEAHTLLENFVLSARDHGKRCLLVITGKGKGTADGAWYDIPEGVLKQKVPQWLSVPPLREAVLKVFPAHRTHGGGGALYVYLRKSRGPTL